MGFGWNFDGFEDLVECGGGKERGKHKEGENKRKQL